MDSNPLETLFPEVVELEPEDFDRAAEISDRTTGEAYQWQTYLNALALSGFEQWWRDRSPEIALKQEDCTLLHPAYANLIEAVCNLKAGEFSLCLLATDTLAKDTITIPRVALDVPKFAAHFYLLLEVTEEEELVTVVGLLRYDQWLEFQESEPLAAREKWYYDVPRSWFAPEPDRLLFYTRYLEPGAIPQAAAETAQPSLTPEEVKAVLERLRSPSQKLWNCASWEQGVAILSHPQSVHLLYEWQTAAEPEPALLTRLQDAIAPIAQQAVNVASWLQGQLDRTLDWAVPTSLTPATAAGFRFREVLSPAIAGLRDRGMEIPETACGSSLPIELTGIPLELFAATWQISEETSLEWSLLLLLRTKYGGILPRGLQLQIGDRAAILHDRTLENPALYLSARVSGDVRDRFLVTITVRGESKQVAFAFEPALQES